MSISFDNGSIVLTSGGFATTLTPQSSADSTITLPAATSALAIVAGSTTQVQYNNAGVSAGSSFLTIDADQYPVVGVALSTPTAPSAGAKLYTVTTAGNPKLAHIGANGLVSRLQSDWGTTKIATFTAAGTTTSTFYGMTATATGTATTRTVGTTGLLASTRRIGYVSGAAAGSSAGIRHSIVQFWRGNLPRAGGFHFVARFGMSSVAAVNGQRSFVGMVGNAAALANAEPSSTNTGIIGFGVDSGDASWSFMSGAVGSAAVKVGLVGTFPPRELINVGVLFEAHLFCAPNSNSVSYSLQVLDAGGSIASGTVTTNLPANNVLLAPQIWTNNFTTTLAAGIDVISMHVETAI